MATHRKTIMNILKLKLIGDSQLLMHSARFADPLDEATKAHKVLTSKKKKTDEDHEAIAHSEWLGGLYFNAEIGPYIPTTNIRSCLKEGARLRKLGKSIERGVTIFDDEARLEYPGPRDPAVMWTLPEFRDCRSVVIGGKRIMRYRPVFRNWSAEVEIGFDASIIDAADILQCMDEAGRLIGLGDYRPNRGGSYGRFSVEQL
jgi:hypothetical protein